MIAPLLAVLGFAAAPMPALSVTFPDRDNPSYYHVMSCRGAVLERTRPRRGGAAAKHGRIVYRCDGPMTTRVERSAIEPPHDRGTDWAWRFENERGVEILSGQGAKVMASSRQGWDLYVREGYLDP